MSTLRASSTDLIGPPSYPTALSIALMLAGENVSMNLYGSTFSLGDLVAGPLIDAASEAPGRYEGSSRC